MQSEQHEEMKEWVLAVSVDKQIDKKLLIDQRGSYEASLVGLDGSVAEPCIVTGNFFKKHFSFLPYLVTIKNVYDDVL